MQGQRSISDPFSETVDLNQGPNFSRRGMNESDEDNNMLSPTERQLLSNDLSVELNFSCVNTDNHHNPQVFSSWDVGESSSRSNEQNHDANDGIKVDHNRLSSFGTRDSRFKERESEPSNTHMGNSFSGSNHTPMNVDLNIGYGGSGSDDGGTSSELGTETWGLSCKRKALEGTSGQLFASGSPTCSPEADGIAWHSLPVRFNTSSSGNLGRRFNGGSSHQSARQSSHDDYLDQGPISTSANSSHPSNPQPPLMNLPRNVLPFPMNSRNGSSSSSAFSLERGSGANFRSTLRNDFVPSNEMTNLVQDPTNWSLATGRASTSSRNTPGSFSRPSNAVWMPNFNSPTQSQQRLSEVPPWALFPSSEAEFGGHRGRFPPPPSRPLTLEENVMSSGHEAFLRSAPLMEVAGDEWHAFAADIEGRHRLVAEMCHILNAMRRGENLRSEDYMLFDPFINGVAELHDRHRDMRLDVDNMSYEELLALEERIGDVNTGLSEEVILKSMKQRKHISFMAISTPNLEPCCICREVYDTGDVIGILDCGHDFHTYCIKQWLTRKNLCPICKMTGLST